MHLDCNIHVCIDFIYINVNLKHLPFLAYLNSKTSYQNNIPCLPFIPKHPNQCYMHCNKSGIPSYCMSTGNKKRGLHKQGFSLGSGRSLRSRQIG